MAFIIDCFQLVSLYENSVSRGGLGPGQNKMKGRGRGLGILKL